MIDVPFLDLKAQYKSIKPQTDNAIKRVVESQNFVSGDEVEAFEKEFAKYLGVKYVVGVSTGTDALVLALISLGIGKGDEVITPVNSFVATTAAIVWVGATPVLVDIDPKTYEIDVNEVEKKINKKTKAILPVHLFGAPSEIDKLKKIAKKNSLYLIEDTAQAHGATFNAKKLGSFGDLGVFSFYPGKNLGAYGEAGAIATNRKSLYKKLLMLRNHGQKKKYFHDIFGLNLRMDEIQAAVLRIKLKHLDAWNKKRNEIANAYNTKLKKYKTQKIIKNGKSVYHIFIIESDRRDKLQKYLHDKGIKTQIHYPIPIHLQKAYKNLGYKNGDFPNAERLSKRILSIPIYAELTYNQRDYIIKNILEF